MSENLRENKSSVSSSDSKIVEDLKKKKHDFIYAIQTDDNPEEVGVVLTEALCNLETILCYFLDLDDYAKVADEVKDLLSRSDEGELLLGEM